MQHFDGKELVPYDGNGVYHWSQGQEPWKFVRQNPFWSDVSPIPSFRYRTVHLVGLLGIDPPRDIPELIWCKIYNSDMANRDLIFFACFAFQNRHSFELGQLLTTIKFVNRRCRVDHIERIQDKFDLLVMEFHKNNGMHLCNFYAYSIERGFVLDLNKHARHEYPDAEVNAALFPNDSCLIYIEDYNRLVSESHNSSDSVGIGSQSSYNVASSSSTTEDNDETDEDVYDRALDRLYDLYAAMDYSPPPQFNEPDNIQGPSDTSMDDLRDNCVSDEQSATLAQNLSNSDDEWDLEPPAKIARRDNSAGY